MRTAAILGLPPAEHSGAVLSCDDGARFYVLAVADADQAMLDLVPVASARRRSGSLALDAWWQAVGRGLPADVAVAITPWTEEVSTCDDARPPGSGVVARALGP